MKRAPGCPSDLDLEELLAGKANPHADGCPLCAERLKAMRETGAHFEQVVFPRAKARVLDAATASRPRFEWRWALLVPLAAALLVFAFFPRGPSPDYIGDKGGPQRPALEVYLGEGQQGRRLSSGASVHGGDGLRFVVSSRQRSVFLFTVDSTGRISRLYPTSGEAPAQLDGLLPNGAILDDVAGPERVFAVFPERAMTFSEIEAAVAAAFSGPESLRKLERLPLDSAQDSVLLEKVAR